jgi:hypothetical protein
VESRIVGVRIFIHDVDDLRTSVETLVSVVGRHPVLLFVLHLTSARTD